MTSLVRLNFLSLSLSLAHTQEISVTPLPDDEDNMMAESEGKFGVIPSTYVELL